MFAQHAGVLLVTFWEISARRLSEGDLVNVDPSEGQCTDAVKNQAVLELNADSAKPICMSFEEFYKEYSKEEAFGHERIARAQQRTERWHGKLSVMAGIRNLGTDGTSKPAGATLQAGFKTEFGEAAHRLGQRRTELSEINWLKCREDAKALDTTLCLAFAGVCEVEVAPRVGDGGKVFCTGKDQRKSERSRSGRITPRYDADACDELCGPGLHVIRTASYCSRMCALHARKIPVVMSAGCCAEKEVALRISIADAKIRLESFGITDSELETFGITNNGGVTPAEPEAAPTAVTPATIPAVALDTMTAALAIKPAEALASVSLAAWRELKPMSPSYIDEVARMDLSDRFSHFVRHWVDTGSTGDYMRIALRDVVLEFRSFVEGVALESPGEVSIVPPFANDDGSLRLSLLVNWKPSNYRQQAILYLKERSRLRQRMEWSVYQKQALAGQRVLICGAGPAGLRMAIELRLHGAQVVVVESREYMTRANVLVIWDWTKEDLYSLGMKDIYPDFAVAPDKQTVPIGFVQHALLRVALIIGVDIRPGCAFVEFEHTGEVWAGRTRCVIDPHAKDHASEELVDFDMVVDAGGTRVKSKGSPGMQDVTGDGPLIPVGPVATKQYQNYAVTANFKRFKNDQRDAFGISQQFRLEAFRSKKVLLDNIVYYKAPSHHYLVATVKEEVLRKFEVVKKIQADLLERGNVNVDKLQELVLTIASDWDIPHAEGLFQEGPQSDGSFKDSFAIFEFSKLVLAEYPSTVMPRDNVEDKLQVLAAVGDALMSPFWPEGTGANRAMIGSMQQTDNFIRLVEAFQSPRESRQTMVEEVWDVAFQRYKALKASAGGDVSACTYQNYVHLLYTEKEQADTWTWKCCTEGQKGPFDGR